MIFTSIKQSFAAMAILSAFILIPNVYVHANDSFESATYWLNNDSKIVCASFDLSQMPSNYFLVFDYSPTAGKDRGKPWAIVEDGKCYALTLESKLFSVEQTTGDEKSAIEFASESFDPEVNFIDVYCPGSAKDEYDAYPLDNCIKNYAINELEVWYDRPGIGLNDPGDLYGFGIWAYTLFPTKYNYTYFVTTFTSNFGDFQGVLKNDVDFKEAFDLYNNLAKDLNQALNSCDARTRVEHQYKITPQDYNNLGYPSTSERKIVWKIDETNFYELPPLWNKKFGTDRNSLEFVSAMGCTETYLAFLREHASDFERSDVLAELLLSRYPIESKNMVEERDPAELQAIKDFPVIKASVTDASNDMYLNEKNIKPTELDEPTVEKKIEILNETGNTFVHLYLIMPFVTILVMGAVLYFSRKRG